MTNPIQNSIEYNRKYFAYLDEFFVRATGKSATEFASIETFSEVVGASARDLAQRGEDAFTWLDTDFRTFVARRGGDAFADAKQLGGMNLVLGGSSRFGRSQLNSTSATVLYSDTVFIPDPVIPWMERERTEEKFRHLNLLQAVHALLHLKPLVDADLPFPAVLVFPSWEKLLEDNDPQTQSGISHLFTDMMSCYLGENLASIEEVFDFANRFPDQTYQLVESNRLFVAQGGPIDEPLSDALIRYENEVAIWRSDDWLSQYRKFPPHVQIINGILERVTPIYHLLENAQELGSNPLLSIEQQAHYFGLVSGTSNARLAALDVLDPKTTALVNALSSKRLEWLGGIPIETLVNLRQNNENLDFRKRLHAAVTRLHKSSLGDINRVASEVCHDLEQANAEHEKELRKIQSKYNRTHGQTAILSLASAGAALMPALAPLLGSVVPLALAGKYWHDKASELSEKRAFTKSLLGVLAVSKTSG